MKTKNILIATTLIPTALLLSVGCSSNNEDLTADKSVSNLENESLDLNEYDFYEDYEEVIERKDLTQEEIYNLHKIYFPKIQEIFKDEGIEFELAIDRNSPYEEPDHASYFNFADDTIGTYSSAIYDLDINSEGKIKRIEIIIGLNTELEYMQKNPFKFEDSVFNKISKVVLDGKTNYSKINKKVNDLFKNESDLLLSTTQHISNDYGNVYEDMSITHNGITYNLTIEP